MKPGRVSEDVVRREQRRLSERGFPLESRTRVYLVADPIRSLIKIGSTEKLLARVRSLRIQFGPLGIIGTVPGNRGIEMLLHHKFRACRRSGEWFEPQSDLAAFATHLAHARTDIQAACITAQALGLPLTDEQTHLAAMALPQKVGRPRNVRTWIRERERLAPLPPLVEKSLMPEVRT